MRKRQDLAMSAEKWRNKQRKSRIHEKTETSAGMSNTTISRVFVVFTKNTILRNCTIASKHPTHNIYLAIN